MPPAPQSSAGTCTRPMPVGRRLRSAMPAWLIGIVISLADPGWRCGAAAPPDGRGWPAWSTEPRASQWAADWSHELLNTNAGKPSLRPVQPAWYPADSREMADWAYEPNGTGQIRSGPLLEGPLQPDPQWWTWQVMPQGLMYQSYLAGVKEPRFAAIWNKDKRLGHIWDTAIGTRMGLVRYGTTDHVRPEGWQIDLEGGFQARLDPLAFSTPLIAVDFRVGLPITWSQGPWQFKTGYYHVSAHLGDEYLLMFPDARRLNYVRDAALLGIGYYVTEELRLYAEAAYAVGVSDGAEPWEFQIGADLAPADDTGLRGAPFAAINAHFREEVNFNGNLVVQFGWAWRRDSRGALFRLGLQYYRGKSDQYSFYDHSERKLGWGLWADF